MFSDYPDVLTVEQLASILQISMNSAYKLVHSDQIEIIKVGNQIRITKRDLLKFLHFDQT